MDEMLHSIRFPETWQLELDTLNGDGPSDDELDPELEALLGIAGENAEYVPIPGRADQVADLIRDTVELANSLELNVDIERTDSFVLFRFYDALGVYLYEHKDFFGKMFLVCDDVSITSSRDAPSPMPGDHLILSFYINTHTAARS